MATTRKPPGKPWAKGTSGNPAGRPAGVGKLQRLRDSLEKDLPAILASMVQSAIDGDPVAARLVLDKVLPNLKPVERPVSVDLPDTATVEGVNAAQNAILQAVAAGDLMPGEGQTLSAIVESKRRAIETQELSERITQLESARANNGNSY